MGAAIVAVPSPFREEGFGLNLKEMLLEILVSKRYRTNGTNRKSPKLVGMGRRKFLNIQKLRNCSKIII